MHFYTFLCHEVGVASCAAAAGGVILQNGFWRWMWRCFIIQPWLPHLQQSSGEGRINSIFSYLFFFYFTSSKSKNFIITVALDTLALLGLISVYPKFPLWRYILDHLLFSFWPLFARSYWERVLTCFLFSQCYYIIANLSYNFNYNIVKSWDRNYSPILQPTTEPPNRKCSDNCDISAVIDPILMKI